MSPQRSDRMGPFTKGGVAKAVGGMLQEAMGLSARGGNPYVFDGACLAGQSGRANSPPGRAGQRQGRREAWPSPCVTRTGREGRKRAIPHVAMKHGLHGSPVKLIPCRTRGRGTGPQIGRAILRVARTGRESRKRAPLNVAMKHILPANPAKPISRRRGRGSDAPDVRGVGGGDMAGRERERTGTGPETGLIHRTAFSAVRTNSCGSIRPDGPAP